MSRHEPLSGGVGKQFCSPLAQVAVRLGMRAMQRQLKDQLAEQEA